MRSSIFVDSPYAVRMLMKYPGFSLVVIVTLALGIGANTAMFGIIKATMIEPLPYRNPEHLVRIWETTPEGRGFSASEPNYLDFRDGNRSFQQLAAYKDVSVSMVGDGEPVRVDGLAVTHDFFSVLGVAPARGRAFVPEEDLPGGDSAVVVLGHALWQRHFAGVTDILGHQIDLEGRAHVVVGVMPASFDYLGASLWVPLAPDPASDRGDHWLSIIGRLQPTVNLEQAHADLAAIAARIGQEYPSLAGWGVRMESFSRWLVGTPFRQSVYLLFGAVGLLLLMACANLANLLFVHTSRRQTELGVRAALGAGRGRLARQLLAEVLLLAILGILSGLAIAWWMIAALPSLGPGTIPRLDAIRIDSGVLGFSVGLGLLTSLLFALAPLWHASRVDVNETLKQGGRTGVSIQHRRMGDSLVVVQIALALVLLVGAGLLIRSFMQLQDANPGFEPDNVLVVELQLGDRYAEPWQKVRFFNALIGQLEATPGIVSAGATVVFPFSGTNFMNDVTPVERASSTGAGGYMQAGWRAATPGFFRTMAVPLLQGGAFADTDQWDGPPWAVVTRRFAEQMWPGDDPIGKEFYWGGIGGTPRIVAGVVGDFQDVHPGDAPQPLMFVPYNQLPWPKMTLLVRTDGKAEGVAALVRDRIRGLDASLPIPPIQPLIDQISQSVAVPRFRAWLLAAFASVALLLSAIGVYGVMAANANRRRREVGLRIALGARPASIARMLLLSGARLAVIGTGAGLLAAWALTGYLQNLLYATESLDPAVLASGALLLAGVALTASWLPARRAALTDPLVALRHE